MTDTSLNNTKRLGGTFQTDSLECGTLFSEKVEPWPEPVTGQELLDELAGVMRRFVVLPEHGAETLALWVLHTYAFELRGVSTYIGLESPEKRCGKTTLLSVLSELVNRPVVAANISSPAFFRVIEETRPTLLIDEADTLLQGNDELRGILNAGYTRQTAFVVRVGLGRSPKSEVPLRAAKSPKCREEERVKPMGDGRSPELLPERHAVRNHGKTEVRSGDQKRCGGQEFEVRSEGKEDDYGGEQRDWGGPRLARFSCWCPKVIAAIGRLPETLADRCIVLRMQRKTVHDQCERLRNLSGKELRRRCLRFVQDHAEVITGSRPELPNTLNDRAADIWEPLLVLGDLAGLEWGQKARAAAIALSASTEERSPIGSLLLDILVFFCQNETDRALSRELLEFLNSLEGRPWSEARRGKGVTDLWLAAQLRPYGVRPRMMRKGEESGRGYLKEDLTDTFRRYISRSEVEELKRGFQCQERTQAEPGDRPNTEESSAKFHGP